MKSLERLAWAVPTLIVLVVVFHLKGTNEIWDLFKVIVAQVFATLLALAVLRYWGRRNNEPPPVGTQRLAFGLALVVVVCVAAWVLRDKVRAVESPAPPSQVAEPPVPPKSPPSEPPILGLTAEWTRMVHSTCLAAWQHSVLSRPYSRSKNILESGCGEVLSQGAIAGMGKVPEPELEPRRIPKRKSAPHPSVIECRVPGLGRGLQPGEPLPGAECLVCGEDGSPSVRVGWCYDPQLKCVQEGFLRDSKKPYLKCGTCRSRLISVDAGWCLVGPQRCFRRGEGPLDGNLVCDPSKSVRSFSIAPPGAMVARPDINAPAGPYSQAERSAIRIPPTIRMNSSQ